MGDHLGSISGETEALLSGYRYMVPLSGRSEDPDDYPPPAFDPLPEAEPQPMQRYYPYGATRSGYAVSVSYQYTGQRHEAALGLYDYNARWYDPSIGRFIQADTIVPAPGNPQSLNRYAYVYNNPLRYTDRSGFEPTLPVPRPAPRPSVTPTGTPIPPPAVVLIADLSALGQLYISQGMDTNDCGPANVGMGMNYAQMQMGGTPSTTLADALEAVGWGTNRVPQFMGEEKAGATAPWGVAAGFKRMSRAQGLGWTATWHSGGTLSILVSHLAQGRPVAVVLIFDCDSAHYVTVVGYNSSTNVVSFLDPVPGLEDFDSHERVRQQDWGRFSADWGRRATWTLGQSNLYIVFRPPSAQGSPAQTPGPVPRPRPTPTMMY